MRYAKTTCALKPLHKGEHRTEQALANRRAQKTARRVEGLIDPQARARWSRKYRLSRYSLTQERFDLLLEAQGQSCGMCHEQFEGGQSIFIDHDHECCPDEKKSCGECVRGILCRRCNTGLGYIERMYKMARAYLDAPPATPLARRRVRPERVRALIE
jgi:hypothetical protein